MYRKLSTSFLVVILALAFNSLATLADDSEASMVLSLEQALEESYANSNLLQAANQQVTIAQQGVKQAQAGFLPELSYEALTKDSDTAPEEVGTGSISATLPLYTGGKLTAALKMAKHNLTIAEKQALQARQQLTYNIKSAYYGVWLAQAALEVAQSSYDNLQHHVERVEQLYKAGSASKFNLLQAEVQRDRLKPDVIKANNQVELAKLGLSNLIGWDRNTAFTVNYDPSTTVFSQPESVDTLVELAYSNRLELKELQIKQELVELQVKLARAGYKPNIGLSANYTAEGADLSPQEWTSESTNLILSISGKINAATHYEVTDAKAQLKLLEIQTSNLKDNINLEVKQALQTINENIETTKANQANIELARESLRMTEIRYEAGMATTMDIMDSQLALDQALNGYYTGISTYLTACAKLDLVVAKEL